MKTLNLYILKQILTTGLIATTLLTFILVLGNLFQKVFELLVNYDIPFFTVVKMVSLLIPPVLTFTIPWALLISIMLVFGRMSHDLEIQAIKSSGIGLAPVAAPVVILSLTLCLFCLFNNSFLGPESMRAFKLMVTEIGRNNPTFFFRAQEPIDKFDGYRIFIENKYGNTIEGVYIWQIDDKQNAVKSVRADRGVISVDFKNYMLNLTLYNVRQEDYGKDTNRLEEIQSGIRAKQLPVQISIKGLFDSQKVKGNISNWTIAELGQTAMSKNLEGFNIISILTEMQKRVAFSFASFTFALIGIPLALMVRRRETSISMVVSLGVVVGYYILIVGAMSFKEQAAAFPELIVWLPNFVFQTAGFLLLWRVNRFPA